jgi:hypothetical protein
MVVKLNVAGPRSQACTVITGITRSSATRSMAVFIHATEPGRREALGHTRRDAAFASSRANLKDARKELCIRQEENVGNRESRSSVQTELLRTDNFNSVRTMKRLQSSPWKAKQFLKAPSSVTKC